MRIAYPLVWNAFSSSGVLAKVENQAREWNAQGHEVRIFIITPPGDGPLMIDPSITSPIVLPLPILRRHYYLSKISTVIAVGALGKHLWKCQPNVIYHRSHLWQSGIIGRLPGATPYILELNTLAREEFRLLKQLGAFQSLKEHWLLSGAAGLVAVSDEIAKHYACHGRPSTVVANGFPAARLESRPPPHNQRPQIIFVGTPDLPWHGVDKILRLAARLPEWDFHLVGPEPSEFRCNGLSNIHAHGYMRQAQIANLYRSMDVGIGTLALHRKRMSEASPLKVREYVAYGLPVIAGYYDTDLSGCDFFLDIGNTEDNVLEQEDNIRAFVAHWQGRAIDRTEVLKRIDSGAKEVQRLEFMAAVVDRTRYNATR